MKVPLEWLAQFVDIAHYEQAQLADSISQHAFEVEEILQHGHHIQGPVVAAQIVHLERHPNADKLQLVTVRIGPTDGTHHIRHIVCGANNIQIGQMVPLAMPGSIVVNRKTLAPLSITESTIRGSTSQGMLCSAGELGLHSQQDGIHILPDSIELGTDIIAYLGLGASTVLDIGSRSNRDDALCVQGMAREIAVTTRQPLLIDYYTKYSAQDLNDLLTSATRFDHTISDYESCSGAIFACFRGVQIGAATPQYIKKHLELCGMKSVNCVVDILNYVMVELGQPMHAYDAATVDWQSGLRIQHGSGLTRFAALDGREYQINDKSLLVLDHTGRVLALAGVMGGLDSAITDQTTDIIVEMACFDGAAVRRSSRYSGVSSESSRRFERGSNPHLLPIALLRTAQLLCEHCGAQLHAYSANVHDGQSLQSLLVERYSHQITLRPHRYKTVIGTELDVTDMTDILCRLGFAATPSDGALCVSVPVYRRRDVTREIDLIEEIARFHGLNGIQSVPLSMPPALPAATTSTAPTEMRRQLVYSGFVECITSSFSGERHLQFTGHSPDVDTVTMLNPVSKECAYLRRSVIPSLLDVLSFNNKRQISNLKIFEIGKVFDMQSETDVIALLVCDRQPQTQWDGSCLRDNFFTLKGIIESLNYTGQPLRLEAAAPDELGQCMHPGMSARVYLGPEFIGHIGSLHPQHESEYGTGIFFAELHLPPLCTRQLLRLQQPSESPFSTKDITIDVTNSTINNQAVLDIVRSVQMQHLTQCSLKAVYQHPDSTASSLTYRLQFQAADPEHRLSNADINSSIDQLKARLQELEGLSIRA